MAEIPNSAFAKKTAQDVPHFHAYLLASLKFFDVHKMPAYDRVMCIANLLGINVGLNYGPDRIEEIESRIRAAMDMTIQNVTAKRLDVIGELGAKLKQGWPDDAFIMPVPRPHWVDDDPGPPRAQTILVEPGGIFPLDPTQKF